VHRLLPLFLLSELELYWSAILYIVARFFKNAA
jgi:hypothetical protein